MQIHLFLVLTCFFLYANRCGAQVTLTADGKTDTYTLLASVLGKDPIDGPDCSHPSFGPHITQGFDDTLNKYVFNFFIHVTPDNDRCINFDRQRNEIKVDSNSDDYLKGYLNDTMTYQWKFKLAAGFQPSYDFFHIHQIKGGDGGSSSGPPLITLTPRKKNPNIVQLIHVDSKGRSKVVAQTNLTAFEGTWVEATEIITYGHHGAFHLHIKRLSDGAAVFDFSSNDFDIWAPDSDETTWCRPKWGLYRSLGDSKDLRDEKALFDDFCIAKGDDKCPK